MKSIDLLREFSQYNYWINKKIIKSLSTFEKENCERTHLAIFQHSISILNHILAIDLIWLNRFRCNLKSDELEKILNCTDEYIIPDRMNIILFDDIESLRKSRENIDSILCKFIDSLKSQDLFIEIRFTTKSERREIICQLGKLLLHQLNHQTSHRGDVLSSMQILGLDIGNNDLLGIICTPQIN